MSKKQQKKSGSPAKRRSEHTTGRMLIPTVKVPPAAQRILAAQEAWREARRAGDVEVERKLAGELHAALDAYAWLQRMAKLEEERGPLFPTGSGGDMYCEARDSKDGVELKVGDKIDLGNGHSATVEHVGDGVHGVAPAAKQPEAPGLLAVDLGIPGFVTITEDAHRAAMVKLIRLVAIEQVLRAEIGLAASVGDTRIMVDGVREPRLEVPFQLEEAMLTLIALRQTLLGYGDRGREVTLQVYEGFARDLNGEPLDRCWSLTRILDEAGTLGALPEVLGDLAAWVEQEYPDWRQLAKKRCDGCGWTLDCPKCEACKLGADCACRGPVPEEYVA